MKPIGGKRKGAGRVPDSLKHKFQRILEEADAYNRLKRIMQKTGDDEVFMRAMQIALERGFGKPIQEVKPVDDEGNYRPLVVMLAPQTEGFKGSIQ